MRESDMAHALAMTVVQVGPFLIAGLIARRSFRRGATGVLVGLAAVGAAIAIAARSPEIVDGRPSAAWKTPTGQRLKTRFITGCPSHGFDCACVFERVTKNETIDPGEFARIVVAGGMAVEQTHDPNSAPQAYLDAIRACRA